jgi:hypothetical protein
MTLEYEELLQNIRHLSTLQLQLMLHQQKSGERVEPLITLLALEKLYAKFIKAILFQDGLTLTISKLALLLKVLEELESTPGE